ncbi:D-alanyl-D-alanine carboxypeptidase/D-alanyl-D-alanine endopeptidase [Massilia glaciei]|uniref:D-alanyl-D-alanine carboxypeptidase/D-alanyl-D-alanine-endopeptidase n=1 Tax=Massilia glaciei TaxID=1524097 RepID=A0A2U2H932_9BURK|nr:D-alanyl-D-alanine carboxypeptidase/D-alanyl-D-alanine-endopeptidase [Massilia glaciei]PWF39098.1 D-alanyl-D-alanine carboxypeptidase/D-alanyl-D-alanine-endopeptidase [Massilia glaciei]
MRLLLIAALFACHPGARAQLPEPVAALMAKSGIAPDELGLLVLRGDGVVLAHGAERPMHPASTIKVLTTLVGLEQLGPVFRGRTELRSAAPVVGDTLMGDLVVRGGADPDFSGEALAGMLQSLRNQGIARIKGRLVFDRQLFNPPRLDLGAPPFDEYPEAYYNVIPDALMVNKNMLQLDMRSGADQVRVTMVPALEGVSVESRFTLIEGACAKWEDGWKLPEVLREAGGKLKVVLRGTFPKHCASSNNINIVDRHDYLDRLLRLAWGRLGGTIDGPTVDGAGPPEARLLAEHSARALPELVRDINKISDNTLARLLYLSLGSLEADRVDGSRPTPPVPGANTQTTLVRADQAVRAWLRGHGIDDAGLVLENGSGLSRLERISARQLGGVLQAGLRSIWAPEYMASLPIVAMDGTMRRRLPDSPAAWRARLKSGSVNNVVAVAGYVPDMAGQQHVVVAMVNSPNAGRGRGGAVLDALVDWVARRK